jgi:cytochrome oxidase assembly protein ShyY1
VPRRFLTPRWLGLHAALVVVVMAFGVLGWWQWQSARHNDREAQEQAKHVAVALSSVAEPGHALGRNRPGQIVTMTGEYAAAEQLLVADREHAGRTGFYVVTPLRTPDSGVIAVNRGWVPTADDPAVALPAALSGVPVEISGVLQASESPQAERNDASQALPEGQIGYLATTELTGRLPYPPTRFYDGFVLLSSQQPAADPAPVPVPQTASSRATGAPPWQNFSYAAQWWLFAAAAIFFWVSFLRHSGREEETPPPADPMIDCDVRQAESTISGAERHS